MFALYKVSQMWPDNVTNLIVIIQLNVATIYVHYKHMQLIC